MRVSMASESSPFKENVQKVKCVGGGNQLSYRSEAEGKSEQSQLIVDISHKIMNEILNDEHCLLRELEGNESPKGCSSLLEEQPAKMNLSRIYKELQVSHEELERLSEERQVLAGKNQQLVRSLDQLTQEEKK